MPAGRQAIGERLYVFTRTGGVKTTNECVIEAHGEQLFMGNTLKRNFTVPALKTIHLYTPHGAPQVYHNGTVTFQTNPNRNFNYTDALKHIAKGTAVAVDTYTQGQSCPNYNLTKIQKTGGIGWSNYWGDRNDMTYDDLSKFLDYYGAALDIITIRNRCFHMDLTLYDVITTLSNTLLYNYNVFHCSFCRSAAWYQCGAPQGVVP